MNRLIRHVSACSLLLLSLSAQSQEPPPIAFVAATWDDTSVHLLADDLTSQRSFSAGASLPNGIATDGTLIYTGHFSTQEVIAYDFNGAEQFRWSATLNGLQGMDLVGAELAVYQSNRIEYYNPADGTFLRSFDVGSLVGNVEGIAFDGSVLWLLSNSIVGVDPSDGALIRSIPNAASACSINGTGLAASAPGELIVGCSDGDWSRVSSADGSVLESGNNGLNMFGLRSTTAAAPPAPLGPSVPVNTLDNPGLGLMMLLLMAVGMVALRKTTF